MEGSRIHDGGRERRRDHHGGYGNLSDHLSRGELCPVSVWDHRLPCRFARARSSRSPPKGSQGSLKKRLRRFLLGGTVASLRDVLCCWGTSGVGPRLSEWAAFPVAPAT
jgi:hypothetical protein